MDGWATARTLLGWRDELVDAGWSSDGNWVEHRLADLAAVDAAATELLPGLTDRVAAVVADLGESPALPIQRIRLIDAREVHSAGWRKLLARLEACGVVVEQLSPEPAARTDTALRRLQRWMTSGQPIDGEPDGSITVARSASAALAAEITSPERLQGSRALSECLQLAVNRDVRT
ncbi:hypothetical protein G7A66_08310 [Altererythrobacter sp. SALINAS58]|nr:hypothetical protein [Alteripontixanthobacter muriae]